jgi:signal transduction histidine kinase/putative methionine-R-sulfoxide reductase with GAF domain
MWSKIRRASLRTKIITWSFVPTAIILLAVALVTFSAYQQVTETFVIARDQELTRLSAGQLATELAEYTNILMALARTEDISHYSPAVQQAALKQASNRLVVFDGDAVIIDPFGTVVATQPERPDLLGQDWSDHDFFRQMLRAPGPIFTNIMAHGPQGSEVVAVVVPIIGSQGEFLGAIAGMFRLGSTAVSAFYGDILKLRLGESGNTYLVDGSGRVIYHSDIEHIGQDFSTQTVVQQVLDGQGGAIRTRDFDGQNIVAGFSPVPGTPWGLVTEESWAALTSGSRGYQRFLLLLLVLGVVVPAMVVTVGVRRITQPIAELIGAAQEVAGGNFGQTIRAKTGDEIEELAEQFNLMAAQLQESYANLERKVADRTRELSTLLEVSRNVASILELEPLLGLILDQLKSVVDYNGASILTLDGGVLKVLAYRGPIPLGEVFQLQFPLEEAGANREVIQRGEPVFIPDVWGDTPLAHAFQEAAGDELRTTFGYIRSWMGVPLIVKDQVVGMLSLDHNQPNFYTRQQAELALAFAAQAAVAIDNARLYAETRRRADEIETLFNVQQAIASPLEWDEVLQLIADEARRLTSTRFSMVFLLNEGDLRLSTFSGQPIPGLSVGFRMAVDQSAVGSSIQSGQAVLVSDVDNDPRVNPEARRVTGAKSLLVVPLLTDPQPMGVILVADKSVGALGPDDERVLSMLASGAVIQLENARLYQEEQTQRYDAERRRQVAEGLRDILTILNSTRPLNESLESIVAQAGRLLSADAGVIYRLAVDRQLVTVEAASGMPHEFLALESLPLVAAGPNQAILNRQPFAVPDLAAANADDASRLPSQMQAWVEVVSREFGAYLAVPLIIKDEVYGAISLYYCAPREFSGEEIGLAVTFADQAALAIENARLYERAQQVATIEERQRLARELHDAVTQTLFSASLIAEVLPRLWERNQEQGRQRLDELRQLTRGALAEMRTLLLELRPAALVDAELGDLLRQLAESITGRARVPVTLEVEGKCVLPPEVKVALYRIAQEALNNVAKHADASQATVSLHGEPQRVKLRISDDGRGFDPSYVPPDHLGLGIMRERAEAVGATMRIKSQPGQGTQVEVAWTDTQK